MFLNHWVFQKKHSCNVEQKPYRSTLWEAVILYIDTVFLGLINNSKKYIRQFKAVDASVSKGCTGRENGNLGH